MMRFKIKDTSLVMPLLISVMMLIHLFAVLINIVLFLTMATKKEKPEKTEKKKSEKRSEWSCANR